MLVYRVETSSGTGPYSGGDAAVYEALSSLCWRTDTGHPEPWNDGIEGSWSGTHHCGFSSIEKLLAWFDRGSTLGHLHRAGFSCSVYEVPTSDVIEGCRQVVFIRPEKPLRTVSLLTLKAQHEAASLPLAA